MLDAHIAALEQYDLTEVFISECFGHEIADARLYNAFNVDAAPDPAPDPDPGKPAGGGGVQGDDRPQQHGNHPVPHDIEPEPPDPEPPPGGRTARTRKPDYAALRPLFGWADTEVIKRTFELTTQYARIPSGTAIRQWFKSRNPALNVPRRNEPVAMDYVYSDTPAVDNGSTGAVIFVGTRSHVTDVYGVKTDGELVNTLQDNIRDRGALTKLISDNAKVNISDRIKDFLRALIITSWQSESYHQHQNFAERRWQIVKE